MNAIARTTILALIGAALAGCASIGEKYQRPEVGLPANWQGQPVAAETMAWPDREWWKAFRSEELDRLIARAQSNNYDLQAAAARVAQARANSQIASAGLYPSVTLDAGAARVKASGGGGSGVNAFSIAPRVSYEVDIWGRNRYTADAAEAALLSSRYAQDVVALTLTADVATGYFQILSFNDRIQVAYDNLANAKRLMTLIEAQKAAGKVSAVEVERQRTQVASAEAAIPPLLQGRQVARDALAVLLGSNPGELALPEASLRPVGAPVVPLGLPSLLLERRPDVRQAEADLISANADIGAARAALFPRLDLSARGGFAATSLRLLGDSGTGFYTIGLDLLATIFDGGALSGQVDVARGRKEELVANYKQSIVSAFRDVEDALVGIEQFALQEKAQQEVVVHAREAYRLAEIRYKAGAADYSEVLDAQRTLISAEASLDPVRFSRFSSIVGLYRALGGGWDDAAKTAAATDGSTPRP